MSTRYEIRGFLRPTKNENAKPGCSIIISFDKKEDAEAIYKRISVLFTDYELHLDRLVTSTTCETIAGNSEFVKDCRSWGESGPHASMIAPAKRGHKRITGRAIKG